MFPQSDIEKEKLVRRGALRGLLKAVFFAALMFLILAVGWVAFVSFYDGQAEVLEPKRTEMPSKRGDETGRVLFLGDSAPTDTVIPYLEKHGFGYQYSKTRPLLSSHDGVVVNLEAPLTTSDKAWPLPKKYTYKIDPAAVGAMKDVGFDVVGLANNHAYDYGSQGLSDTLQTLDEAGIRHIGAGESEREARRGIVLETAGGNLGVLAYMQDKFHWRVWVGSFALDAPFRSFPGSARLRYGHLARDISRMRKAADAVAVYVHWGDNYKPVNDRQRAIARACVDYGADVVIGHHPHEYQQVAMISGRPVLYSIGNYTFGTRGHSRMRFGVAATVVMKDKEIHRLELIPLLTQNRITKYVTRIPSGKRLDRFMKDFLDASQAEGAALKRRGHKVVMELGGKK